MRYSASLAEEVAGVLAATVPLGMPSGKARHHPGWKPLQGSATTMSQARLHARAGSPDPSKGTCTSPSGFHRRDRATSTLGIHMPAGARPPPPTGPAQCESAPTQARGFPSFKVNALPCA
eukprot:scaffold20670_cov63-Phaeocystis_antarctica.AAC.2